MCLENWSEEGDIAVFPTKIYEITHILPFGLSFFTFFSRSSM